MCLPVLLFRGHVGRRCVLERVLGCKKGIGCSLCAKPSTIAMVLVPIVAVGDKQTSVAQGHIAVSQARDFHFLSHTARQHSR